MDSSTEDIYLQQLAEFVHDEDKIVTFTWLSAKCDITINYAKQLLEKYVQDARQLNPNALAVTYVLLGLKDGKKLEITLSKGDELQDKIAAYHNITSQHIYSIQKTKGIEFSALSIVEPFNSYARDKPLLGSVVGKNCVKRVLKRKTLLPLDKPLQKDKPSIFKKASSDGTLKEEITEDMLASKPKTPIKPNKQKQNGIASFFSKASSETSIKERKPENENIKSKQNGMMGIFFSKAQIKTVDKEVESSEVESLEESKSEIAIASFSKDVQVKVENDGLQKSGSSKGVQIDVKERAKQNKKSKTRRKDNKSEQPNKKRKRIVEKIDSDSNSDDIFSDGDEDNDGFVEETEKRKRSAFDNDYINSGDDEFEPIYKQLPRPKNKKRKQTMQTFTDEDGYIITKKQWVYESGSESEQEQLAQTDIKPELHDGKKFESEMEISEIDKIGSEMEDNEMKKPDSEQEDVHEIKKIEGEPEVGEAEKPESLSKVVRKNKKQVEEKKTLEVLPSKLPKARGKNVKKEIKKQQTLFSFFKKA